jgi:ribosomal protein S18 acetylase RimI-like enzyme
MNYRLPDGYCLRSGNFKDKASAIAFMKKTYRELFGDRNDFSHLAPTVESYLSAQTPLWWVDRVEEKPEGEKTIACLWIGSAIDQTSGDRQAYIFLLYVAPEHRRQGIATALMHQAETWTTAQGMRQIALQVFGKNQNAVEFYRRLGYQVQSLCLTKTFD